MDDATRDSALILNAAQGVFPAAPERPNGKLRPKPRPVEGEDNTNRKLLNLPPIVGSCLQYANKSLPYRPFPPGVDDVRKKMFSMEQPLLLDSQQIADYWPHISNVYMRSSRPHENDNGTVSEAWECRIRRRVTMKGKDKTGQGLRQRQSKDELLGDVDECKIRLNLLSYTKHVKSQEDCGGPGLGNCNCVAEWLYIERTNHTAEGNVQHTHSLDLLDVYKRSDAVMYFCKVKVEEGQYSYAAVLRWAKEKYGSVTSQLQHLNKADVANVARFWRQQHKDVELRPEIVEETDEHRQRKDCLDSIQTTSAEQLRKALAEVCKVYPHAVDMIAPFMEKSPDSLSESKPIAEGIQLNIPPPGRPRKRKMACDPPSPSTVPQRAPQPPGSYQLASQAPQAYSPAYQQVSSIAPQNAVRGFRITLPSPASATASAGTKAAHGVHLTTAPPPPPYPVAPQPAQLLQYPRPSIPQPNGNQRSVINGNQGIQDRPSWAQPAARKQGDFATAPFGVKSPIKAAADPPSVQGSEEDIEEQLRNELS